MMSATIFAGTAALAAEEQHTELRAIIGSLRSRLDRMILTQGQMEQPEENPGYQAAINLTREGADNEVLMNTCGLTRGEAHLIRSLYQSQAH